MRQLTPGDDEGKVYNGSVLLLPVIPRRLRWAPVAGHFACVGTTVNHG
jgi:hypothetical protein